MFFKAATLQKNSNVEVKSLEKPFVSEDEESFELETTTISQSKILWPDKYEDQDQEFNYSTNSSSVFTENKAAAMQQQDDDSNDSTVNESNWLYDENEQSEFNTEENDKIDDQTIMNETSFDECAAPKTSPNSFNCTTPNDTTTDFTTTSKSLLSLEIPIEYDENSSKSNLNYEAIGNSYQNVNSFQFMINGLGMSNNIHNEKNVPEKIVKHKAAGIIPDKSQYTSMPFTTNSFNKAHSFNEFTYKHNTTNNSLPQNKINALKNFKNDNAYVDPQKYAIYNNMKPTVIPSYAHQNILFQPNIQYQNEAQLQYLANRNAIAEMKNYEKLFDKQEAIQRVILDKNLNTPKILVQTNPINQQPILLVQNLDHNNPTNITQRLPKEPKTENIITTGNNILMIPVPIQLITSPRYVQPKMPSLIKKQIPKQAYQTIEVQNNQVQPGVILKPLNNQYNQHLQLQNNNYLYMPGYEVYNPTTVKKAHLQKPVKKTSEFLSQPEVKLLRNINYLGISTVNPERYVAKYGKNLINPSRLEEHVSNYIIPTSKIPLKAPVNNRNNNNNINKKVLYPKVETKPNYVKINNDPAYLYY